MVRSFLATIRGPQHLLRASACCAACDCVRSGADFEPKFSKIFAAAKFCVRNCARSRLNRSRLVVRSFLATLRGPRHLLRASACCAAYDCVRSGADFEPKFSKIFTAAKFCVRNCARSRLNGSRLVVRSFLATIKGPQHLLRASACCAACDCVRSAADFEPKFSKIKNLRSNSREIAPKSKPPGGAQLPRDH